MKVEHSFRQSWIKDAMTCPERARRNLAGTLPHRETDAAAVGTAVHAGIEAYLGTDKSMTYREVLTVCEDTFQEIEAHPSFVWAKYSHRTAMGLIDTFLANWWEIGDKFDPQALEYTFNKIIHEDDERIIRVTGTIDLIDKNLGLVDWKTSGRGPYEKWEYERWAIQPTVYTWAMLDDVTLDRPVPFTYNVIHKNGVQEFTVWRDEPDWLFLKERLVGYAHLIEANLDVWPKHDNHALCSAKWCPAWGTCKGKLDSTNTQ